MSSHSQSRIIGQQIGNYRLLNWLGQGSFADVYLGEHIHLKRHAAIKVLKMSLADEVREHFLHEARTVAGLDHPHIIRVLECGIDNALPFLVMNYATGGSLRQRHPRGTRLSPAQALTYVQQAAAALHYSHQQKLIHRDVKPENMLLDSRSQLLLSDFGLVLICQSISSQTAGEMAGTISYMAPEQFQGKAQFASDQYALGVVTYEWLCGECPFNGTFAEIASQHMLVPPPPLREKVPTLSEEVEQVVLRALSKDPAQRFVNTEVFAGTLAEAITGQSSVSVMLLLPVPLHSGLAEEMPSLSASSPIPSAREQEVEAPADMPNQQNYADTLPPAEWPLPLHSGLAEEMPSLSASSPVPSAREQEVEVPADTPNQPAYTDTIPPAEWPPSVLDEVQPVSTFSPVSSTTHTPFPPARPTRRRKLPLLLIGLLVFLIGSASLGYIVLNSVTLIDSPTRVSGPGTHRPSASTPGSTGQTLTATQQVGISTNATATSIASNSTTTPSASTSPVPTPTSASACIAVTPLSLTFTSLLGQDPSTQTLTVTNCGNTPSVLSYTTSSNWILIVSTGNTIDGNSSTTVIVEVVSLKAGLGTHSGSVQFSLGTAPQTVMVNYTAS
jgi:serine/threonine protein kinase